MPPQPFLYLPDAISLTLLFAALTLLRDSAIAHLRQELLRLRKEMILYWSSNELPFDDAAYQQLRALLAEVAELAPRLSPARFFFISRLVSRSSAGGMPPSLTTESPGIQSAGAAHRKMKPKLQRIFLEMNLAVGMFFLLGSISGWMLLSSILIRLAVRKVSGRRSTNRMSVFDLAEKLISRIGFNALRLGIFANRPLG